MKTLLEILAGIEDEILTAQEAADFLGKSIYSLSKYRTASYTGRQGPDYLKIGNKACYRKSSLIKYMLDTSKSKDTKYAK